MKNQIIILELFFIVFSTTTSTDLLLEPIKQGSNTVALLFLPGAELPPDRYLPLLKQVQLTSLLTLWIAIPSYPGNIPIEQIRPHVIDDLLNQLHTKGMPTNISIFIGGHSLGGYTSQNLAFEHSNQVHGQILIGAFITRKHRENGAIYPVPTLTLSGELDGLARVSRIIESFRFYSSYPHFTLIIPGMNHMETASGTPSAHIEKNDIRPEINETQAHQELADRICDYIDMLIENRTTSMMLEKNLNLTREFSNPYLLALEYEGFYHFLPPCNNKSKNEPCQIGSQWSELAQEIMSDLIGTVKLNVSDEFHVVYALPERFAHLDNNCSTIEDETNCTLNIHTITQNVYDPTDSFDTGEPPISADEMRVKMISRQVLLQASDGRARDFNQTDGGSLCGSINQQALQWALAHAANVTRARYEAVGKKIVIGDDIGPLNAGPLWIWTPLQYQPGTDSQGKPIVTVRSPTLRTPINYPVSAVAGFHYCKLLSPARALEWIYIDSLKP